MKHVKVPQDRIGVLIGEGGETMREIEQQAEVRLNIDSETGSVAIDDVGDPVRGMLAPDIVRAIGRGFTPTAALSILDDEMRTFELIDLDAHTRNKNDLQRQKGRLIGENGRTRELMEELTGAEVVIRGTTLVNPRRLKQFGVRLECFLMALHMERCMPSLNGNTMNSHAGSMCSNPGEY